jgi:hypothetical protein
MIAPAAAASRSFPPAVAMYVVKIACERPDELSRCLSQWDCTEVARQLVRDGVVSSISAEAVRRILVSHRLKPWRQKMWLSPKVPRGAAFAAAAQEICDLYTRPLRPDEVVLCADEMTSLQPRPRKSKTLPTDTDRPTRVEHEYGRCGAPNLFAAFDTRTGKVYGMTAPRKRQAEFITFLERLDGEIPASATTIHVALDNLRMHKGEAGAGVAGEAPAVRLPSPAGALLVDEPGGAVVQHPQAEAAADRRLRRQGAAGRAADGLHPGVGRGRSSVQLDHEVGGEGHGQVPERGDSACRDGRVGFPVLICGERY